MLFEHIQESLSYIQSQTSFSPRYGLILGTGLGNFTDGMEIECEIPYSEIPHFAVSTVATHKGKLVFGNFQGIPLVAMAGRFHYYEGYSMKEVTFPVRVMRAMGIKHLFISNISGSTNADILAGDIVFIRDHINLQPENPLRGVNDERLGPRFPDMLETYDKKVIDKGIDIARGNNIRVHRGVYVALQGPNLETPAEYEHIHRIGGDLVGMSTVPEVIVARHGGLPVNAISVVSNLCYPTEEIKPATVEDMIQLAQEVEPKMQRIVGELLVFCEKKYV